MYQNGLFSMPGYANMAYSMPFTGASNMASSAFNGASSLGATARGGLFSRLASGISKFNFSNFLGTTQKTLGVINQAIPVFYQVKPIWNNAKTMFRVMGAINNDNRTSTITRSVNSNLESTASTTPVVPLTMDNQPQFFL